MVRKIDGILDDCRAALEPTGDEALIASLDGAMGSEGETQNEESRQDSGGQ